MPDNADIPNVPEMVERVARAIVRAGAARASTDPIDLEAVIEASWPHHVDIACAALHATREPTEAMLDAPWRAQPSVQLYEPTDLTQVLDCVSFARVWASMVAAALEG